MNGIGDSQRTLQVFYGFMSSVNMMVDNMDTVVEDQLLRKIQETIEKTPLL